MRLVVQHFGGHVVQGAAEGHALVRRLCGPPKIADFHVPLRVDKNVFRFEIPMNNALFMKVIDSDGSLDEVNKGLVLCKFAFFAQIKEQVPVLNVFEDLS